MSIIIRYSKSIYETKIGQLEGYANQLQAHLQTLEGLKDQVKNFWDDDEAADYLTTLSTQIIAVRNALDQTNRTKMMYEEVKGDLDKTQAATSGLLSEAGQIISSLGIGGE